MMRKLIVAIWCVIPAVAHAQDDIPEQAVKQIYQQCLPTCEAAKPYAFCSRVCACIADEMATHWTMADFQSKGAALSRDPDEREVRAQIDRIAGFCADRAN